MPTSVQILQELYAVRKEMDEAKTEVEQGPLQLKGSQTKVDKAVAVVAGMKDKLKTMRKESDAKELTLKAGEQRRFDLQGKLNAATNVKDFNAIKEEIARLDGQNGQMEIEGLEALTAQEGYQIEIAAAEGELAAVREKHAKLKEIIDYRVEKFANRLKYLEAKATELEGSLDPDIAEDYRRVIKRRGAGGLAPCSNAGVCGGCNTPQTPQTQQNLALGKVQLCGSCGSLLFRE